MKALNLHKIFFLSLLLFCIACTNNQNKRSTNANENQVSDSTATSGISTALVDTLPGSIEEIQKAYARISNQLQDGVLDSTSFTYNCMDEKSGNVSYFSLKGNLRMIVHRFNEYDHHEASAYYYVMDSTLFFVYTHTLTWSFESGPEGSTKDNITEHRVYFIDREPVKCLEKKYVIRSQLPNNPSSESIPNDEINCSSISVVEGFQNLLKYRYKATTGCL